MKIKDTNEDGQNDIYDLTIQITDQVKKLQKGVRCALGIPLEITVKTGDTLNIKIEITLEIVEELKIDVTASGKAVWKVWGIFPYIADYQANAVVDVYDYTGINFTALITLEESEEEGGEEEGGGEEGGGEEGGVELSDIESQIKDIIAADDSDSDTEEVETGLKGLVDIYGELVGVDEEESSGGMNFVELFKKELFSTDIGILMGIINIHIEGDFVVQASMKVALGCRFDYTVGQRYNFWVRVKDKDAGSTTTQISDEKYNFEFYVVGILGIKAGVQLEISITLISDKLAAVGLTAEAGVYGKFYGYFYFELHSVNGKKSSDAWGTVYIDFGAYLEIKFKASLFSGVTDKLTYNPTLFEKEWSLLTFGDKYNVLDFYRSKDSVPTLKLKYVTSLDMPTSVFNMKVMDLTTGKVKKMRYNYYDAASDSTRFSITFDNEAFYYDTSDGKIKVRAEDAAANKMLDGNMTVTWLGTGKEISFRANSISITYPVHWDCVPSRYYNIGFTNTPEYTDTISALCGDPVEMPVPVKEGYTFVGWKKSMSDSFVSYTTMPGEDVYLYAVWTPNTDTPYKVLVQLEDANGKYQDYQTYSFTGTTDQKAVVDINDATFAVQDYVPRALPYSMDTTISADGSRVIVLQMERQGFAIVYHMGGATSPVCYCKFGTQVDFVPKTEKTGYTFGGWYSDAELTQRTTVPQIMPVGGIDLYAKWIPKNYTITYISDNGDVLETCTVAYGTAVGDAYVPAARENAAFRGWYESRFYNGNQYEWDSTFNTLGRNLVLYARWDIEIILDSDGGTECGSIWVPSTNATSATLPTPVKYNDAAQKNFVFCGWFFTDGDGELTTNEYYRDKLFYVAEGYTLKAKWEPNAVKVTFDASYAIKGAWYRPTVKVITAGETVLTTSESASGWVFCVGRLMKTTCSS